MATYPTGVYSPRTKANRVGVVYDAAKTTVGYAEDVQKLDAEVVAIETELGLNPKGGYADVAARLAALGSPPVKCSGDEINTGTDDAKFATAKAIKDSDVAFLTDIPSVPVKATGAELDTGTDDAKFATAKALADSAYAKTTDIPVKATGAEVDTGTDDAKFMTAKSIEDSAYIKAAAVPANYTKAGITIDGGGSAITTGIKGRLWIPYACTINSWTLLADVDGAIKIDIWRDTYANYPPTDADSITNAHEPEIVASGKKAQDTDLADWTDTTLDAGDILIFNVDSAATITWASLILKLTQT